ncbi:cilia- and flagella-associated protein 251 [Tenrec ecaudatus]|uniref:cilia- and flagella-associated protein 251 n=1 Tax=Tenrec ecaudatus TaxID=94439 RepID=UPI003F59B1DB
MSDAKENPLEETEKDEEAEDYNSNDQKREGEEEFNPNVENMEEVEEYSPHYRGEEGEDNSNYQKIEEYDQDFQQVQGRGGEGGYNSNSQRIEEEGQDEEYHPNYQSTGEQFNANYQTLEGGTEEYSSDYQRAEEEGPYYQKEESEDYNPDYQDGEEEGEEYKPHYQKVEEQGKEDEDEHANDKVDKGREEENLSSDKGGRLAKMKSQGKAAGTKAMEGRNEDGQEEELTEDEIITVPQKITKAMLSFERLMLPGSHSSLPGASIHSSSGPTLSLDPEDALMLELSQAEISDLEPDLSEDQLPSDKLREKLKEAEAQMGRDRRQEKQVSYMKHGGKAHTSAQSLVSSTTEDALFKKQDNAKVFPLTMTWTFGWNSSLPVFSIRGDNRRVLLYACAHTAVIYDVFQNNQHHLQGHTNVISCLCVSEDRRWIATADKGPNCLIIIWDSYTGIPVHTLFDSCPDGSGIRAIAITRDAKYLATISDSSVQKMCIWKWTLAVETPACTLELNKDYGVQNYLIFNPTNNKELVSNSKTQVVYYSWHEEKNVLAHSAPLLTEKTFNKHVGKFSQSVFHLNLTQILSATMEGKLVVWDVHRPPPSATTFLGFPYIKPCKLVHLQKEGITVLTTVDSYIVIGDIKGNIKFYDSTLSIVNWYSHLKLSAIRTLSFSKTPAPTSAEKCNYPQDCTLKGDLFIVRNFIIATSDATVYHLTADGTKLEKLFVEPKDAVYAISCHPYQPLLAIGSLCGMIKVWDYEAKTYLFSRVFEKGLGIQSLNYNPEGAILGAGFTQGTVYILDAMSLENATKEPFRYSRSSVTHISFSHDSEYMATADVSFTVSLYRVVVKEGLRVWEYLARLRSHRKSICSLLFGVHLDSNEPRLLSLGKDRLLIEYNLPKTYKDHLEVLDIHRTDQGSHPTCMVWYPPLTKELFLLICNSSYKVMLFNSTTKMCRKTLLGPTYGSPIEQVQLLPVKTAFELQKRYLVFINKDKVGLQILPVDGNPHKTSAIICHPSGVVGVTLSYDGCSAFTAGGEDHSVAQWEINLRALDAAVSLGGEGLTPFYGLVSGGREGQFYRELEDYFYYSQLRSQGIDTMETRQLSECISLSELPYVMRAIGFYPSEEKIDNMFNEIKFGEYVDTGKLVEKINLPDFLKVYINHRPPFGNTLSGIQQSFDVLGYTNAQGKKAIRREDFLRLLQTKGEHMTKEEMLEGFATLFGLTPEGWKSEPAASALGGAELSLEEELPDEITAEIFATDILGLTISEDAS